MFFFRSALGHGGLPRKESGEPGVPGGRELSLGWAMVAPEGSTACPPAVCALCPPPKASGLPSVHFVIITQSHCLFAAPAPPPPNLEVLWRDRVVFYLSCSLQNLMLRLARVRCPVGAC